MRSLLSRNIAAKIVAVICAFALWVYATNEQNPPLEVSFAVPLETRNVTNPLVAVDLPEVVKVKLRGSSRLMAGVTPQDIKCYVDLKDLGAGSHSVKVIAQAPSGLEILEVSPERLQITLDSAYSSKMPAEVWIKGSAAAGTAVAKVAAVPEQVTIQGPRNTIELVDKVRLPIDLSGKNADFKVAVTPILLDRDGKLITGLTVNPDKVNVSVSLVKGYSQKSVDVKPIIYGDLAGNNFLKGITVKPVRIDISGTNQVLDQIDVIYTEPVNIAGISQTTTKEARLQLKEGVLASQSTVTVQISVAARH